MLGLRSQFAEELVAAAVIAVLTTVVGVGIAWRERRASRAWLPAVARVLAVGAVAATIAATAMPTRFGIETDGDLVLQLGRGGLGDWRVLLRDPLSLSSIQLVANVLLYAVVACAAAVGWFGRRRYVIPACIALSVGIELIQWLLLGRVGTLDDVVLNSAGAILGYLIAVLLLRGRADRSAALP